MRCRHVIIPVIGLLAFVTWFIACEGPVGPEGESAIADRVVLAGRLESTDGYQPYRAQHEVVGRRAIDIVSMTLFVRTSEDYPWRLSPGETQGLMTSCQDKGMVMHVTIRGSAPLYYRLVLLF